MQANAHALFNGLKQEPSYLARLTIPDEDRKKLMNARNKIRTCLRTAVSKIRGKDEFWDERYVRSVPSTRRPTIEVKFMTQGSFAYGTINAPIFVPQQQIDLDDGMYIPVEFLENGEPALTAKGLFEFVEQALGDLCDENNWSLDETKSSCVRVCLSRSAHIDVPIYSVPADRFERIVEALREDVNLAKMSHGRLNTAAKLPSDQVMLAKRNGTWLESDPQKLHDWVMGRVERYGPVYRRLSRFFKGWRDFSWPISPLSSLCIMCAVDKALQNLDGAPVETRDDALVLEVAAILPDILDGKIKNPVLGNLILNDWTNKEKLILVDAARELAVKMKTALTQTGDATKVVQTLIKAFGDRMPDCPDAVKFEDQISVIQKSAAASVPAPSIITSTSA